MTDYDKLRELAERALTDSPSWWTVFDICHGIDESTDAEFIAAASPDSILNLLEDLRITRAERDAEKHKNLIYRKENR